MNNRKNIKATWNIFNGLIKGNKSSQQLSDEFVDSSNNKVHGIKNIAQDCNVFVNIGPKLASNIPVDHDSCISDFLSERNASTFFIAPVTESEIIKVVNGFKNKTSKDCDEMSMHLVKNIINLVCVPFSHICNLSFASGVFPDKIKIVKVLPLFKSGGLRSFNNYRPVSLLPQFSKILENLFETRLNKFVENMTY